MSMTNTDNVSDPSDWKLTCLPVVSQLDSLQRCYICKDFLKAPVITSCNHTFCSICIRQYLLNNDSCPLCKSTQFESNLRRDVLLEEIINCFSNIRPMLLDHLKSNINSDHENDVDSDKTLVSSSVQSSPKRKLEEEEKDDKDDKKKVKVSESLAECPICEKFMDSTFLQTTHIDACLSGKTILPKTSSVPKKTKTNISSFFKSKEPKKVNHEDFYFNQVEKHVQSINRLPKLDFKSLTTPKLKEKLSSVNLSTNGTRNQLELRYNQYYILFNSNLDSNHPVDTRTLKQQLMSWESSHSAFNSKSVTSLFTKNTTKSIIDKNFSVRLWKRMYHMEFKELIEQAKKNIKITKEIEPEFKTNSIFIGDED